MEKNNCDHVHVGTRVRMVARCRHGCPSRSMQIPEHTPRAGGNRFTHALHSSYSLDIWANALKSA